jgi:L-threonylcarbamoyladenylate synthase
MQVSLDALVAGAHAGSLVSFPTDTVPALAALPEQGELIFAAKQRSRDKPLILMAASADELWPFVTATDNEYQIWQKIANKYWPGALTLVLPASTRVPKAIYCGGVEDNITEPMTVGIRVPNSTVALTILARTGALATSSANLSGQPPLLTMTEIEAQFPNVLTLAVTECHSETIATGLPSTVAKWTGKNWQILRQGAIKIEP